MKLARQVNVRITDELKKQLEQMAKEDQRSFNNLVNKILTEAVKQGVRQ